MPSTPDPALLDPLDPSWSAHDEAALRAAVVPALRVLGGEATPPPLELRRSARPGTTGRGLVLGALVAAAAATLVVIGALRGGDPEVRPVPPVADAVAAGLPTMVEAAHLPADLVPSFQVIPQGQRTRGRSTSWTIVTDDGARASLSSVPTDRCDPAARGTDGPLERAEVQPLEGGGRLLAFCREGAVAILSGTLDEARLRLLGAALVYDAPTGAFEVPALDGFTAARRGDEAPVSMATASCLGCGRSVQVVSAGPGTGDAGLAASAAGGPVEIEVIGGRRTALVVPAAPSGTTVAHVLFDERTMVTVTAVGLDRDEVRRVVASLRPHRP